MKKFTRVAFLIAILCSSTAVFCQYANLEFIENKGQWDQKVKFKGVLNNGAFFLQEKGFRVVQHKAEDLEKLEHYIHGLPDNPSQSAAAKAVIPSKDEITVHSHAYDVEFVNALTPVIRGDKPLQTYNNYFIGNDRSKWKSNCKIYQAITYQDIYKGIDARYYTNEGQVKYDLIIHPGADLSQIVMKYDGVDGLEVKDGQLNVKTSVGEVHELRPYAFTVVNGIKQEVGCRFKVIGKTVQFDVDTYNISSTLIIDPTLIFSSFTGSAADNWGYTATYGPDGSFYAGGIVFGTGFPTNPGAYQASFNGGGNDEEGLPGFDIGIMKFTPNGSDRTYATYLGGTG